MKIGGRWLRVFHLMALFSLGAPYLAVAAPHSPGQISTISPLQDAEIPAQAAPAVELSYALLAELPAFLPYSLDFAVEVTGPTPLAAPAVVSVTLPPGNLSGKGNPQPDGVALGWTLGTSSIARKIDPDGNGAPRYLEEYTLVLNGVSRKLISLGGNRYALENERYWKIARVEVSGDTHARGNRGGDYWLATLPDGVPYRFGYQDESAGPEIVTDALGHASRTGYDMQSHQFPVVVSNAKDQSTTTEWDLRLGAPITLTDPNGVATGITYDSFGRVIAVTPPGDDAPAVEYTYPVPPSSPITAPIQAPFAVKTETRIDAYLPTPQYQSSWTIYDGLGRVIQTQSEAENGLLILSDTTYDNLGRPVMASLPYTVTAAGGAYIAPDWSALLKTVTTYDLKGRIVAVTAPDGSVTRKAYRPWSELLLDANGRQTAYINDGLGRLIEVHEYDGTYATPTWNTGNPAVTKYTHDAAGNLIRVEDALGHVTTLSYDALGRKTAMDDPSMGAWSYKYDDAGNLIEQTDAEGQTLVFEYDELNRLIRKSAAGGSASQRASGSASQRMSP